MKNKKKKFDAVEMKRNAQKHLYEETKKMTSEEELVFYRNRAKSGSLAEFWKQIQLKPTKKAI